MVKLEKLNLEDFMPLEISGLNHLVGGSTEVPPGGCTCPTGGGETVLYTYSTDTEVYNGNGVVVGGEHHSPIMK